MEQYINKLLFKLRIEFVLFLLMIVCVAILGFCDVIPNGIFRAQNAPQTEYIINITVIAVTFISIAAALKLFKLNTEQNIKRYTLDDASNTYHRWSIIRLVLLFVAIALGLVAYFTTFSDSGLFCAAIVLMIVVIFCLPSFQKIKTYIEKSQKEI